MGAVVPGESLALVLGLVPTMTTPSCADLLPEGIVGEHSPSHTMKAKVPSGENPNSGGVDGDGDHVDFFLEAPS